VCPSADCYLVQSISEFPVDFRRAIPKTFGVNHENHHRDPVPSVRVVLQHNRAASDTHPSPWRKPEGPSVPGPHPRLRSHRRVSQIGVSSAYVATARHRLTGCSIQIWQWISQAHDTYPRSRLSGAKLSYSSRLDTPPWWIIWSLR
jgi:hypothetical protein